MLYMTVGSDFDQRKQYKDVLLQKMQTKRPDAQLVILDTDNFKPHVCDQYLSSVGLFDAIYKYF